MSIELHVVSGARAGQRAAFEQPVVTIGRHPACDFRFDPEQDREVSTRHAELRNLTDRWVVLDTNSTNGTFVNGTRIHGEAELRAGDVLSFGTTGPRVEIAFGEAAATVGRASPGATRVSWGGRAPAPGGVAGAPPVPSAPLRPSLPSGSAGPPPGAPALAGAPSPRTPPGTPPPTPPRTPASGTPTSVRIAAAVQEHTKGLRRMLVGVTVMLVLAVASAIAFNEWQRRQFEAETAAQAESFRRQQLEAQRQYQAIEGRVASLDSAFRMENLRAESLQQQLRQAQASGSESEVTELSRRIRDSQDRIGGIVAAAQMDLPKVNRLSGPAVVFIATQQQDGKSFSGSGFNVLPGGLVVTNRHVVHDPQGRPVRAVRVLFNGRRGEWLPARVVRVGAGRDDDIALLQIEEPGTYPVVEGVAPSRSKIEQGSPVTTIGFPLGTDLAGLDGDINDLNAVATLTPGTVSKLLATVVQIDSYSGQGASGSPLFDRDGHVVGVIYGGAPGSNGRIVYAVPSERLIALLNAQVPREAAAVVR